MDHRTGAQPRGPGQPSWGQERGAELGDELQKSPSPQRALASPSLGTIRAGRFPTGFCHIPTMAPAPRCPLPACRDSPCFSKPTPGRHVQKKAAGSAFLRYGRDKTAQTRDFPRQFGLNFKPLLLSLSRAARGSRGRKQHPGLRPQESPRAPLPRPTPCRTITWGQVGQSPRSGGNPRQPSATTATSLFLPWVALPLNEVVEPLRALLVPSKFGHLCHGGDGDDHPYLVRPQAFALMLGHACFEGLLPPLPLPSPPGRSLLPCFHFCIRSPLSSLLLLPKTAAGSRELLGGIAMRPPGWDEPTKSMHAPRHSVRPSRNRDCPLLTWGTSYTQGTWGAGTAPASTFSWPRLEAHLCHGNRVVQPLTGCCLLARNAHSFAGTSPPPPRARTLALTSAACPNPSSAFLRFPAPSFPTLLPAATGVGAQLGLLERATGSFGKGNRGSFGKGRRWRRCGQGKCGQPGGIDCWACSQLLHLLTSSILAQGDSLVL